MRVRKASLIFITLSAITGLTVVVIQRVQPKPAPPPLQSPSSSQSPREGTSSERTNPTVTNKNGDLSAENRGDFVALWWEKEQRAVAYAVFRSFESGGPWKEIFRLPTPSGVDFTPEARRNRLCYHVQSFGPQNRLLRQYEPVCVPRFKEK